jgi:hypothetical protein
MVEEREAYKIWTEIIIRKGHLHNKEEFYIILLRIICEYVIENVTGGW